MSAFTDDDVHAAEDAVESLYDDGEPHEHEEELRAALAAVAPAIAARAWDEGYAVASDDFTHSDYCGRTCQCDGIHGQKNPYRADEIERTP